MSNIKPNNSNKDICLTFNLIRSKRRTIALVITETATLEVRAPIYIPLRLIHEFIQKKQSWINKKIQTRQEKLIQHPVKKFVPGEEFLYLGKPYQLNFTDCRNIKLDNYLYFPSHLMLCTKKYLETWYKKQAAKVLLERVKFYTKSIGVTYIKIRITNAKTRWGSCTSSGTLSFSWRLIMAPLEIIDYVVVHELTHLIEMNHSKKFWNKVENIMPDYAHKRHWLKKNGHMLVL